MLDGKSSLSLCTKRSAPLGSRFLLSCLNTGSDESGDLIGTKAAGRSQKHMVCGFCKMYLLLYQTFKHVYNSKHLSPVGISMVVRALSISRTGITVLLYLISEKCVVSQSGFYKHVNVSVTARMGPAALLRQTQNI